MHLTFAATYDPDADASYIYVASDRANGDAVRQQHVHAAALTARSSSTTTETDGSSVSNYSEPRPSYARPALSPIE